MFIWGGGAQVLPHYASADGGAALRSLEIIVHQVPQPWHPQSVCMHEACLAVQAVAPERAAAFTAALFAAQERFFDASTYDVSRSALYAVLAALAEEEAGVPSAPVLALLASAATPDAPNAGNGVTQQLKWAVKHHRARGVHVTPTVFVNGIEAGQVSSGWGLDDWRGFLDAFVPAPAPAAAAAAPAAGV